MPRDYIAEFWDRVDRSGGPDACWPWLGYCDDDGYGKTHLNGRHIPAHRKAWLIVNGALPPETNLLHKCDNPPCCNPSHHFTGTQADNIADKVAKHRQARGERASKARLTEADVLEIRRLRASGMSLPALAARFGVYYNAIWMVVHRKSWRHVPDHPQGA